MTYFIESSRVSIQKATSLVLILLLLPLLPVVALAWICFKVETVREGN